MEIGVVGFSLLVAGVVVVLLFCFAFFLEIVFGKDKKEKIEVSEALPNKGEDFDLDYMLSQLEEKSKPTPVQKVEEVKVEEDLDFDEMLARLEETPKTTQEVEQITTIPEVSKKPEEVLQEELDFENILMSLAAQQEPRTEEVVEEKPAEVVVAQPVVVEKIVEEPKPIEEPKPVEPPKSKVMKRVVKSKPVVVEHQPEPIELDYNTRLENLHQSLEKLEKDLKKSTRELNKYERTAKRKLRNEKLLDKKAGELANHNLVMYNVNDIKDIEPEKLQKQEELNIHIAELKESIKLANEYLQANKEKNANAKKLNSFLTKEKERYLEEIKELAELINAKDDKK